MTFSFKVRPKEQKIINVAQENQELKRVEKKKFILVHTSLLTTLQRQFGKKRETKKENEI